MTVPDLYAPYTSAGTPYPYDATTRKAIAVYGAYMRDRYFQRPPNALELRQVIEWCDYFVNAPCLTMPAEALAVLRYEIVRLRTCDELAAWVRGCSSIGLGNVLGGGI